MEVAVREVELSSDVSPWKETKEHTPIELIHNLRIKVLFVAAAVYLSSDLTWAIPLF